MPTLIETLLTNRAVAVLARVILTFPFWGSGLDKLINFSGGVAEMRQFGLEPALFFNIAVFTTQLVGSALIISGRYVWLGAGALGIFTALTIPVVHRFWTMEGAAALHAFHTAAEHIGMIGGLITVSILAARTRSARSGEITMPRIVMAR
ncbi:DoxX family protein [Enterovirga sp. CN4-39]|uniref:DoxX family protein n=1 Tax=Enterovirga sp. CN4-39 TaxID=3400910 RepID=UPI003C0C0C98